MSGLEGAAAVVGLGDVTLRSISTIYKIAGDWKYAPQKIKSITEEINVLQKNLLELRTLENTTEETRAIAERVGLSQALARCEGHCTELNPYFLKWKSSSSKLGFRPRYHYISHRAEVASILSDIQKATLSAVLSVLVAEFSVRLQSNMSQQEKNDLVANTKKTLEELPSPKRSKVGAVVSSVVSEDKEKARKEIDKQIEQDQASKAASKVAYEQNWKNVTIGGQENRWGVNGKVPEGGEQNWEDVGPSNNGDHEKIKNNRIGINFD